VSPGGQNQVLDNYWVKHRFCRAEDRIGEGKDSSGDIAAHSMSEVDRNQREIERCRGQISRRICQSFTRVLKILRRKYLKS
jgi:hypothetical protein